MGLFGKSKKEREKEYMNRLDVPLCFEQKNNSLPLQLSQYLL